MPESATSRERARSLTRQRISLNARRLTLEHGLEGFTMDGLAQAAEVSRRTLFNHFPSKVDAVLGAAPALPPDDLATFCAGGPHGSLIDDVEVLARLLLEEKGLDREYLDLGRQVLCSSPRLLAAEHQRFELLTAEFAHLILDREGQHFGSARARLVVSLVVSIFEAALATFLDEPSDRPLAEVYDDTFFTARQLLH